MSDHVLYATEEAPPDFESSPCHVYGPTTLELAEAKAEELKAARTPEQSAFYTMVLPLEAMPA